MKKCIDCKYGNGLDRADYCGKRRNNGNPYDYDYCLPKKTFNKDGNCEDYVAKPKRRWYLLWIR